MGGAIKMATFRILPHLQLAPYERILPAERQITCTLPLSGIGCPSSRRLPRPISLLCSPFDA
eukprot:scaffold32325_cov26-Tisochrysis_lutea.AAC.4